MSDEPSPDFPETTPSADHLIHEAAKIVLLLRTSGEDPAVATFVAAWRRQSADHARAWMAAQKVWAITGQAGATHAVFSAPPLAKASRRHRLARPALAAGLAVCLMIPALPLLSTHWQADYTTGLGENRTVALRDGSIIQLGSRSAVRLLDRGEGRGVEILAGRAWFDVATDAARPFRVAAADVTVTVTGTQFEVELDDRRVNVELAEGSVVASYPATARGLPLAPGERFHYDPTTARAEKKPIALASIAAWRRGKLQIEGASVAEIVNRIRPYHRGLIIVADKSLASQQVTGSFDLHDPMGALRAVVEPHSGRIYRISPWVLVITGP